MYEITFHLIKTMLVLTGCKNIAQLQLTKLVIQNYHLYIK